MSLADKTKKELVEIAEKFGVDASGTKAVILESLAAEGIDDEFYDNLIAATAEANVEEAPVVSEKPAVEKVGKDTVIRFNGQGSYRAPGVVLTADNPFAVVDEAVAEALIAKSEKLFRYASEKELDAFYN